MSNRADNYLSLCLEQAAKSPLHYRHGCIIVRGGKVIGQGYNDYRSGFSGGALKNGRLSNAGLDGQALCELKGKMKQKSKLKCDTDQNNTALFSDKGSPTFTPFEASYSGNGGGHLVNTPLSMHSEMMAIHSALSVSSTLASSAFASEKPCFKLQGHSKRKDRLRRDQLRTASDVAGRSAVASRRFKSGILKPLHLNQLEKDQEDNNKEDQEQDQEDNRDVATSTWKSVEKHRMKMKDHGPHEIHNDRSGQQTQQQYKYAYNTSDSCRNSSSNTSAASSPKLSPAVSTSPRTSCPRDKLHKAPSTPTTAPPQPLLVPKCRTSHSTHTVRDRMKHPRLQNADLYVARLGMPKSSGAHLPQHQPQPQPLPNPNHFPNPLAPDTPPTQPATSPPSSPTSLHDELLFPNPKPRTLSPPSVDSTTDTVPLTAVHASRPCYRCVAYMHSVGIKRVFWTNGKGKWEGGKVRRLADALDGNGVGGGVGCGLDGGGGMGNGGDVGNGLFVTKHEVLILRRVMGLEVAAGGGKGNGRGKERS